MNAQAEHVHDLDATGGRPPGRAEISLEEIAHEDALGREYLEQEREAAQQYRDKLEALNDRHQREVEDFQRPATAASVRAEIDGKYKNLQAGARHSLVAQELARRQEVLEWRHLEERAALVAQPRLSFARYLEHKMADPAVTGALRRVVKRLHAEAEPLMGLSGQRTGDMSPIVLDGLRHEIGAEEADGRTPVHYLRDRKRVITDHGDRLDLHEANDREIEAGLRIAAHKFDMTVGLDLTGNEEFRTRAAEIAGRLGYKVQNPDLQKAWEAGRAKALEANTAEAGIAGQALMLAKVAAEQGAAATVPVPAGAPEEALGRAQEADAPRAASAEFQQTAEEAQPAAGVRPAGVNVAGEFLLQRLKYNQIRTLEAIGRGEAIPAYLRDSLRGRAAEPDLVTEQGELTQDGKLAHARLLERQAAEREQQQLRTRNVDEELAKQDRERELAENAHDLRDHGGEDIAI